MDRSRLLRLVAASPFVTMLKTKPVINAEGWIDVGPEAKAFVFECQGLREYAIMRLREVTTLGSQERLDLFAAREEEAVLRLVTAVGYVL